MEEERGEREGGIEESYEKVKINKEIKRARVID